MANLVLKNNTSGGKTSVTADNFIGTATHANILQAQAALTADNIDNFLEAKALKWATADATVVGNDGLIMSIGWSANYGTQIWFDDGSDEGGMKFRNRKADAWNPWRQVLTEHNYTSYTPTKTGSGASGTWGISVTGYSNKLNYGTAQLTTDAAIDEFNAANTFQVTTWNSTSTPGVTNGVIINAGWTSAAYGAQIAIDDDPTYYIALRQKGTGGWNAWKRIPMGDGTGASGTWGISITGNAATATAASVLRTDETMKLYAQLSNEVNFGGTNTSGTIYFGYRAVDSKPIPTSFVFGGSAGSANITANNIYSKAWFRSYDAQGWYNETHGCHIAPNTASSYGSVRIYGGAKGGYEGLHFGSGTTGMTVMSIDGSHQGLYNQSKTGWIIYTDASTGLIGIGGSTTYSNYININKNTRVVGTFWSTGDVWGNHFYPNANASYSLGNSSYQFYDAYVYHSVRRGGYSSSWIAGRDNAFVKQTTLSGYSPIMSVKTNTGSWDIGAYDNSSYKDQLIFSYCTDANYNAGTNTSTLQVKFDSGGRAETKVWYSTYYSRTANYGTSAPGSSTPGNGVNGALYFKY